MLPLFRSEMQVRMLALLLLQPERSWTLQELAATLEAPQSSVHRELARATRAGVIRRDGSARPHRFHAAAEDPLFEPLATLLHRSVGVEQDLAAALDRPDVEWAAIIGSWASGERRPNSDIDVLVIGDADLRALRKRLRPIGVRAGRTIDLTVMPAADFRDLLLKGSSFARTVLEGARTPLVGTLPSGRAR